MIQKYKAADFRLLEKWVTDADLLFQFSGPEWSFPLTEDEIISHQSKYPHRQFYIAYNEKDEPYAFGQIIANEENSPRLGRLLIGEKQLRGKGLGQIFIRELIEECKKLHQPEALHLFVYENNLMAIRCYEKLGFKFNENTELSLIRNDKEIKILKMTLELQHKKDNV